MPASFTRPPSVVFASVGLLLVACAGATPAAPSATPDALRPMDRLPTGRMLDPAGVVRPVGAMPVTLIPTPEGRLLTVLSGWREQGFHVLERDGRIRQTVLQPAAFIGAAFTPDGRTLLVSGGNEDQLYRYDWADGAATLRDSLPLARKAKPDDDGSRYPAGVAVSPDGRRIYVAENLADSLAVLDAGTGTVLQRLPTARYPYGVAVAADGTVYVTPWNGYVVHRFVPTTDGRLQADGTMPAGRHPSALLLNADGSRLFVASASTDRVLVLDPRTGQVIRELRDPAPDGPAQGTTPNGLALSADGTRLFVAEADANAVAIFDLSPTTSGVAAATGTDALAGRIPAGWYPTAVHALGDTLIIANGKGVGTGPNPDGPGPHLSAERRARGTNTTLYQLQGSISVVAAARASGAELAAFSARVAKANRWDAPPDARRPYPSALTHVIYIIKENRTYDQVFGDLAGSDADSTLLYFGRPISPNHHALAERFGIYDRFFVNAEVSPDGHNWSMAAYTTDYLQKTVPSNYSGRGRSYDYEGLNRGWGPEHEPEDDVAEPANGYLWDLAQRKGITFRNYGEFVIGEGMDADRLPAGYTGLKPFLKQHTNTRFPAYDLSIPDQRRADVWLEDLQQFVRQGQMPRLQIVRLPNDHTSGLRAGAPTPRAMMADNDLALGRMIEALSRTPFWAHTAVFVLEDDAQNGPDHVDSHRSPMLVISPWAQAGLYHRFANTTDVLRTIEEILGLDALSQFDFYGQPLREIWRATPDLRPYTALVPSVALTERNPEDGPGARASAELDLHVEDVADEDAFNRILWLAAKGPAVPYPGAVRMPLAGWERGR